MKNAIKIAAKFIGGIGSIAAIMCAVEVFKKTAEASGWAAFGMFMSGAILLCAGLALFFKVDRALSEM